VWQVGPGQVGAYAALPEACHCQHCNVTVDDTALLPHTVCAG
jgi:hypothetical protein